MKTNFKPSRTLFYILSFTWGILCSTLGLIAALFLRALGYYWYPNQYGYVIFLHTHNCGGFTLGPFSFVEANASPKLLDHEAGHSYQNIIYGPFMALLTIVSIAHYFVAYFIPAVDAHYYNFWLEADASKWGKNMANVIKKH